MPAVRIDDPKATRKLWGASNDSHDEELLDARGKPIRLPSSPKPTADRNSDASAADPFAQRERIGRYELAAMLGQGTFGLVYTARDTELGRVVALKVLNPSHHGDKDAMHRFIREGKATARIEHPGVVTVLDCGQDGDVAYIALERMRGESLAQRLDRVGKLAFEDALDIARQVASALAAAHAADVLHRDLKPDNIYLVPDPAAATGERVKVFDFGLAKVGEDNHTRANIVFGTPLYMSPEQCRSSANIDVRSDIYALGCILFEMVTGRVPFEGEMYKVLMRQQREDAPRASTLSPDVPPALDALIVEMLAKEPDERPRTMIDVELALQEAIAALAEQPPVDAAEPPPYYEPPVDARRMPTQIVPRRKGPVAALAALTIAVSLAALLSVIAARRTEQAPQVPAVTKSNP